MIIVLASLTAFIVALLVTRQICNPASWLHVLDHPNERSLHTQPVPRTGGVAILAGIAVAGLLAYGIADLLPSAVLWIVSGAVVVAVLSLIDDRQGLSVRARLLGQLASAGLVVGGGLWLRGNVLPGLDGAWSSGIGITVSVLYLV